MTLNEATQFFMKGDLVGFFQNLPPGQQASVVFNQCIDTTYGKDLDIMISNCLVLYRNSYSNGGMESDDDYRRRAKVYAVYLDSLFPLQPTYGDAYLDYRLDPYGYEDKPVPKVCSHEWKQYNGLFETDEYCTKCNERKR